MLSFCYCYKYNVCILKGVLDKYNSYVLISTSIEDIKLDQYWNDFELIPNSDNTFSFYEVFCEQRHLQLMPRVSNSADRKNIYVSACLATLSLSLWTKFWLVCSIIFHRHKSGNWSCSLKFELKQQSLNGAFYKILTIISKG